MKVIKNVILINILWLLKKTIFKYIQLFFQFGSLLSNFARKYKNIIDQRCTLV